MYFKNSNSTIMLNYTLNGQGCDFSLSFIGADLHPLEKKERKRYRIASYMLKLHNTTTHKAWLQIHSGHQVEIVWTVQFAV